jgi:hypothetical protein
MWIKFQYDKGDEQCEQDWETTQGQVVGYLMDEFCKEHSFDFDKMRFLYSSGGATVVDLDPYSFPSQILVGGTVVKTDETLQVLAFDPKIPALDPKRLLRPGPALEIFGATKELWVDTEEAKKIKSMCYETMKKDRRCYDPLKEILKQQRLCAAADAKSNVIAYLKAAAREGDPAEKPTPSKKAKA